MIRRRALFKLPLLATAAPAARADEPASAGGALPYRIPRSAVHAVDAPSLGRVYRIYVQTPKGYDAPENAERRYPVLYLHDGPYSFPLAAGALAYPMGTGAVDPAIIVGVSRAVDEDPMRSRVRDFTPTSAASWRRYETGGAPAYLEFLRGRLIPFVEARWRADAAARVLVGHSLGGLFGAYVLARAPETFAGYALISPSLWFHDRIIMSLEAAYAEAGPPRRGRVYLATGALEAPPHINNDMVGDQGAYAAALRARAIDAFDVRAEILNDAAHEFTFPLGFARAASWLLAPRA
ncbi:MAG: alpha/beta hydrolase [Parvularculaceae bacterium]